MGMEVWHAAEFRVMRYALLHVDTKAGVEMWSRSIRKALNEADQQYIQHNAVLDIYEWAILRAMLLHNKELAKSLLKESRSLTTIRQMCRCLGEVNVGCSNCMKT